MGNSKLTKWRDRLVDAMELPKEIILNLPKVTIIGNVQCYIENHRGVIEYSSERVRVAINSGELIVSGQDLFIRYMANEEIAVDGSINAVQYEL
ncbi:MAG TPA: sporulation protein YqfC [Oscillospiraceae bacterium]|nr:sporulation protein YqfC [Oscillospiraceae bacterium]